MTSICEVKEAGHRQKCEVGEGGVCRNWRGFETEQTHPDDHKRMSLGEGIGESPQHP